MKQWYESIFENYASKYDNESFTQGTSGECDFIENEIGFNKKFRILDIGCGTGRHSIELSKRGYHITGIDLSDSMLNRAKEKAKKFNLTINFLKCDARDLPFSDQFDLAIMLCEGAFPLMETDEMNFAILANAARSLKQGGKLIFTTLNGLFPLFHSVKDFLESSKIEGNAGYTENTFDLMTFRDYGTTVIEDDSGKSKQIHSNERYYVPSEITWMLKSLHFKTISIYGARLGAYSRADKLSTEDFEMLVIAEK
jgi:ubiquinone/menaquinone biosynthesis C-methylase UbiE